MLSRISIVLLLFSSIHLSAMDQREKKQEIRRFRLDPNGEVEEVTKKSGSKLTTGITNFFARKTKDTNKRRKEKEPQHHLQANLSPEEYAAQERKAEIAVKTGTLNFIYNRTGLTEDNQIEVDQASREDRTYNVFFIDINHPKKMAKYQQEKEANDQEEDPVIVIPSPKFSKPKLLELSSSEFAKLGKDLPKFGKELPKRN